MPGVEVHTLGVSRDLRQRSEEHTSELQSPRSTLFPYTTLFRSRSPAQSSTSEHRCTRCRCICRVLRCTPSVCPAISVRDRKSTRLNSSHRDLLSFPTRRSSDLGPQRNPQLVSTAAPAAGAYAGC